MRLIRGLTALAAALLGASGCDGALVPGTTLDRPYLEVKGIIAPVSAGLVVDHPLSVGLLWIDAAQDKAGKGALTSGREVSIAQVTSARAYTLDLRGPPPAEALRRLAGSNNGPSFSFAFAEIILYEDRDGDDRFDVGALADGAPIVAPDLYRGMPAHEVLIYIGEPLPPGAEPFRELGDLTTQTGYHLAWADCASQVFSEAMDDNAALTLGPPTTSFPDFRPCLRSLPTPGASGTPASQDGN